MINIENILVMGIQRGASDIHIVPGLPPVYRINRQLIRSENSEIITKETAYEFVDFFIKGNENLKALYNSEKKLDLNYEIADTRLRVNVSLANDLPVLTARIIKRALPRFRDLGLPDIIMRNATLPQGLILVTGKSNSGKSTTLNAIVNEINQLESKKILMLENPIEYLHTPQRSVIVQKEVGPGKDCNSFSDGTINALREDVDILVVGEIRDKATMDAALEMTEAGHLVIGTMHTKSCAETIDRAINFYDLSDQLTVKYMLSSLLKVVVAQRLIRGTHNNLVMIPEIMIVDEVVASLIRKEKFARTEIEDAIQTRFDKGNISFMNSLANAVLNGQISMEIAQTQLDDKNMDSLNRVINQLRERRTHM